MTKIEFYNKITGQIIPHYEKYRDIIYAYPKYSHYKYIVAFTTINQSYPYIAMDGTNNKTKAIWLAIKNHLNDKLEWVVIEN